MKIVIDIQEEDYLNLIKTDENGEKEIPLGLLMSLWDCVKYNCTSLPKGHGKLIDYSWVVDNVIKKLGIKDKRYLLEAEKALMSIVEIAPTIIEADNESEEEE